MQSGFVEDGRSRWHEGDPGGQRLKELRDSIRDRYADEFARGGILRRLVLRIRMAFEFRRERKLLEPSPESLFGRT